MVANVIGLLLAICGATYSTWLIIEATKSDYLAAALLLLVPVGLSFWMAKIMWALKKKTKMFGFVLLAIITGLNLLTSISLMIEFGIFDAGRMFWFSFGLALISIVSGFCIALAKIAGEIIEKLKYLFIGGIGGFVVIAVMLITVHISESGFFTSLLGTLISLLGVAAAAIVGYVAESILIKKKFMVYN
nr:hypothetical protein [Candidatus Sigynarchaeota archaeon]